MSGTYYNSGDSGNVWSSGSHGGSRDGFSNSNDDGDQNQGSRRGSYRGSYGNSYSRGGGGSYGFRRDRDNDREFEIQKDTIYVQDLPKEITKEQIHDVFSAVGQIKIDDRSGGPKIWIYKDRNTGEANGKATVTFEEEEMANRAVSEYNDQHIDSLNTTVRVQLAQRRPRNNDRGGFNTGNRGYRGGRNNYDNGSGRGFSDNRRGGGGFRGRDSGSGGGSFGNSDDRSGGFSRGGSYRGASRSNNGSSNYAPY